MLGYGAQSGRKRLLVLLEILQGYIPQGAHTGQVFRQQALGLLAGLSELVVCRAAQPAPHSAVGYDERDMVRKWDGLPIERACVEEERMIPDTMQDGEGIHQSALHADVFVLGTLADLSQFHGRLLPGGERLPGDGEDDLDRR